MSRQFAALIVTFVTLSVRGGFAECVGMPLAPIVANAHLLFSGTVVSVVKNTASDWPSEIVTFDVDRVWKGPVTRRFRLYSFTKTPEPFVFNIGAEYAVVARRQTAEDREIFNIPATSPDTFGIGQCGGGTRRLDSATERELNDLGPARPPLDAEQKAVQRSRVTWVARDAQSPS